MFNRVQQKGNSMFRYLGVFSLSVLFIVPVIASEATDEFILALGACDRGLQMPSPKSYGALNVLQILLKKYQSGSREALAIDPDLKGLSTRYEGEVLKSLSFAEAYRRCEGQLGEKVKQAEIEVAKQSELRQRRLQEQQLAAERKFVQKQQAESHAVTAIQSCQTVTAATAVTLFSKYQFEKQQALQLVPEIVQHVLNVQQALGESKRNVAQWFLYCDQRFARLLPPPPTQPMSNLNVATLPYLSELSPTLLPRVEFIHLPQSRLPARPTLIVTTRPPEPAVSEKVPPPLSKAEVMYQELLTKIQGERLKILQQEKRLPDIVNRRDLDYHKATRWQYQKMTASGSEKCVVYNFVNNQQVHSKELNGQCQ